MSPILVAAASALIVLEQGAAATPQNCDAGYQTFLGDITALIYTTTAPEASEALRRSLAVYDSCKAGDAFAPEASWSAIIQDLKSKSTK